MAERARKLIGQNYTPPDLLAKVTGRAKYAEDFRADGMLFCKLLLSPMPHARVTRIDTSAALAMPGVRAILTADDLPQPEVGAEIAEEVRASAQGERGLTFEPLYEGEPILAVAAADEVTAAAAIESINIDLEPLPFAVDPIESLRRPDANARSEGNVWVRSPAAILRSVARDAPGARTPRAEGGPRQQSSELRSLKWTDEDFAQAGDGQLPMGKASNEWTFGDLEAGFKQADLILDETFVSPSTSHQTLETRSAMAYWRNGKVYLYCSTQSTVQSVARAAAWIGVDPSQVVIISEYTGGGFGSKVPGSVQMAIPALLSKKTNMPVMMRISREEEHYIGRARSGLHSRVKVGFRKDGKITAIDLFIIADNGPYDAQNDGTSAGRVISITYQPLAMRWRGVIVLTNTPPHASQRSPGGMQATALMEPVISKAARQLGIDQVAIRRLNAPEGKAPFGPLLPDGIRAHVTSAFAKQALDRGADLFKWSDRQARSGKRNGSRVRGIGVCVSEYNSGSIGFDGLFVIKPDGRISFQSGIGNHGTHSVFDVHRVAADLLDVPWEKCDVKFGNTAKHLPWTCPSVGSQTTHAMTRAAHAAAQDAKRKLQEIAAEDLGGQPDDYEVGGERVFRGGSPNIGLTLAQAASRALELGGKYDGHELPSDINAYTRASAGALVGHGLMAVARDAYGRKGTTQSYVAGFAEVEVDVETGKYHVLEFLAVADVGTVINPRSLRGQILGGALLGMGHAICQKWVYDQHYGAALAKRFHHNKPLTILDAPRVMHAEALDIPDPETPVGARGIGEPGVGAGFGAVLNAIADAVGDEIFRRAPVTADMILTSLEAGRRTTEALTAHI